MQNDPKSSRRACKIDEQKNEKWKWGRFLQFGGAVIHDSLFVYNGKSGSDDKCPVWTQTARGVIPKKNSWNPFAFHVISKLGRIRRPTLNFLVLIIVFLYGKAWYGTRLARISASSTVQKFAPNLITVYTNSVLKDRYININHRCDRTIDRMARYFGYSTQGAARLTSGRDLKKGFNWNTIASRMR